MLKQSNKGLYVYGIVEIKNMKCLWNIKGIEENGVFIIKEGELGAIVHYCEEKPYESNDPEVVKKFVISHNEVINKAMEDFGGVIPMSFDTIIRCKDGKSAEENLRLWLKDEKEKLMNSWCKIKGKKEYGIKIYYNRQKLLEKIRAEIKKSDVAVNSGVSYLMKGKEEIQIKELAKKEINKYKQDFFKKLKLEADEIKVNQLKVQVNNVEKNELLNFSILVKEEQIAEIKNILEQNQDNFPYYLTGSFAPYSFVLGDENG